MDDIEATIVKNRKIVPGYYLIELRLKKTMGRVLPGQFVMLKIPGNEVFLRRPFSVYDYSKNTLSLMYAVVGKGTDILSKCRINEKTNVLGPLGNAFRIIKAERYFVVAGGIGIAGVHTLIKKLGDKAYIFYGCNTKIEVSLIRDIERLQPMVATIDGSCGFKGNVVELLGTYLNLNKDMRTQIFVCGPDGMVRSLRNILENDKTPCQVLVEERMACGLGLCFGCVVKTTDENEPYKRVCKEGPVFDLWEISL